MSDDNFEINLIDSEFSHLQFPRGVCGKIPKNLRWLRNRKNYNGISVFTDRQINLESIRRFGGRYKIAWLLEPPSTFGGIYERVINLENEFDEIWTYSQRLLNRDSDKYKLCIHGGSWSNNSEEEIGSAKKNIPISMIFSNNRKATGHILRHKIYEMISGTKIKENVYFSGSGIGMRLPHHPDGHGISSGPREEILLNSLFTIVIESNDIENYFTEKLIDPLLLKTVPIYWGCQNIGDFFDKNGIITAKNDLQIFEIVKQISLDPKSCYEKFLPHINKNYQLAKSFATPEDWIYKNLLKKMEIK